MARSGRSSPTQRLLAFSRRRPLDPKPTDVNVLVYGLSEMVHRTLGETIAVETVLGAGLWRVEADPNATARASSPHGGQSPSLCSQWTRGICISTPEGKSGLGALGSDPPRPSSLAGPEFNNVTTRRRYHLFPTACK